MNKILYISTFLLSSLLFCQVGINTEMPKTTLDVSAKRNAAGNIIDNTQPYGLQAPRLTRAELTALTATYGADQKGALIYITDITGGDTISPRTNVDVIGYYYFDGILWQKFNGSSGSTTYTANNGLTLSGNNVKLGGALTESTTISSVSATNKLAITGTGVDAINFDNNTMSIDASNNRVGLGTAAPTARLEINNGDINGAIKIVDGTQGAGRVLTSDANGLATWSPTAATSLYFLSSSPYTGSTDFSGTAAPVSGAPTGGTVRYLSTGIVSNLGPATTITSGAAGLSYRIPITGMYRITLYVDRVPTNAQMLIRAYRNGVQIFNNSDVGSNNDSSLVMINIWNLQTGDYVLPFTEGPIATGFQRGETTFTVERVN